MYENITYESILQRMLDRIPNDMDKREGSVIFDALAPAALELQLMYLELDSVLNDSFGDTASREFLIRRAKERGILPKPATFAQLKAVATPEDVYIPIGSRFTLGELHYKLVSKITSTQAANHEQSDNGREAIRAASLRDLKYGEYIVQCEETGTVGNKTFGDLIPIDYIKGLETIRLVELLIPGEDEEETESLRKRYFDSFDKKAYGGNVKDYIEKTNSIAGVGATKVTPVWNGGGTVLLTILNSEFKKASDTLVQTVQNIIDPTMRADGVGIAPIGHIVTVRTVDELAVNISFKILFHEGSNFNGKKAAIESAVSSYFDEIDRQWANSEEKIIRISQIETRVLQIDGVLDISDTTLNGGTDNIILGEYEIPVLGTVTAQ